MSEEKVLVVKRDVLWGWIGGKIHGYAPLADCTKYAEYRIATRASVYIPRSEAEEDERLKQIIPYILVRMPDGKYLTYARGVTGGEERLHQKLSIGVGGHINSNDGGYWDGMTREIWEEIELHPSVRYSNRIIGFVNDESDAVGRVHFGVVHLLGITSFRKGVAPFVPKENCLEGCQFNTPKNLRWNSNKFESWSRFIIWGEDLEGIPNEYPLRPARGGSH